jgi:hypothetical protein
MLPLKTIPEVSGKEHPCTLKATVNARTMTAPPKKKVRAHSVGIGEDEVEDEDCSYNTTMMNASFSSTSSFQVMKSKKVCSLSCHAWFDSNQHSEGPKYEKEPDLFILPSHHQCVQWFSRRHWRCALSLFSWCLQDLYYQEINEDIRENLLG